MNKRTGIYCILILNILLLFFTQHIRYKSSLLAKEFDQLYHTEDTTNINRTVTEFNNWVQKKQGSLGKIYQIEVINLNKEKNNFLSPIWFDKLALWSPKNENFHCWQLVTHMFIHGGYLHLFFNLISFLTLSFIIIKNIPAKHFFILYFAGGVAASILHLLINIDIDLPMVGASGAVWALFGFFAKNHSEERLSVLFLPIFIKAKNLFNFLFILEVIFAFQYSSDGLAHWAHIGGGLFGIIYFYYLKKSHK